MSNFGRAPRSGPGPSFCNPGYPSEDEAKARQIKANAVLAAKLDSAYALLVQKKGCKALSSLIYRDLGSFYRGPGGGDKDDLWANGKVTVGWRSRVTPLADVAGRLLVAMEQDADAIGAYCPALLPAEIRKKCSTWLAPRYLDVAFTYGRVKKYLAPPKHGVTFSGQAGAFFMGSYDGVPRPVSRGMEAYFDIWEVVAYVKLLYPRALSRRPLVIGTCDDPLNIADFVHYNKDASAGLPWNAKPKANEEIFGEAVSLAKYVFDFCREAYDKRIPISTALKKFASKYPALYTFVGAAKDENLSMEKLEGLEARLYIQTPLHFKLLFSSVTRIFENDCGEYGPDSSHAQVGVSFHKGGADRFACSFDEPLVRHLDKTGGRASFFRYSVAGDDTIIKIYDAAEQPSRQGESPRWLTFALDCSSFDLTEEDGILNVCIHKMKNMMSRVSGEAGVNKDCSVIAELWESTVKWRPTAFSTGTRVVMTTGGPSGLQLQSKINSLIMGVICESVKRVLNGDYSGAEGRYQAVVKHVGDKLGFVIKLEQFATFSCAEGFHSPRSCWVKPFLFLGYYLWLDDEDDQVYPWIDMKRLIPNMGYPKGKWEDDAYDFAKMNAVRAAAYYLTAGVPPPAFADSFGVMRSVTRMLFLDLKLRGKTLAGQKANFYDAHYEFLDAFSEDQDASAPVLPDDLESLYQLVTKMDPWVYWAEGYASPAPLFRQPVLFGPFLDNVYPTELKNLPKARAETTFAPVSQTNWGKRPPITAWNPPSLESRDHRTSRELRKMMPQEAEAYHDARFQRVLEDDEFGGELPGRHRKGGRRN